mgnify:CR=1 FL=1
MAGKTVERREHQRHDLACPIRFYDRGGVEITQAKTTNVSDGGVFVPVPIRFLAEIGKQVNVAFSLPRSTPNTYMLEDFAREALGIRQTPMPDVDHAGIALDFATPPELETAVCSAALRPLQV